MWNGLHELFAALSPRGRFWLAVLIVVALLAVFVTMTLAEVDTAVLWRLLGG
jgi:hypothetical protein